MYFRAIVFLILIFLLYRLFKVRQQEVRLKGCARKGAHSVAGAEDLVEDPVCHTHIPLSQAYRREIMGETHYFCGKDCFEKFIATEKASVAEES